MFSFSGRKARVVQVHFDGKLVVRLTKYLDFTEENMDNIKLLLRWMMNEPIGDTAFGSPSTKCFESSPTLAKEVLSGGAVPIPVEVE